jgi:hypothetical protein
VNNQKGGTIEMNKDLLRLHLQNHCGATVIVIALSILALIGFAALAVDIGYIFVVRNELQNAAEAGAHAGACVLYNDQGTSVNEGANQVAQQATVANMSEGAAVEVNANDVQRGHWSFATRTFTPNDSLDPVDLWNNTSAQLDADPNFINAVWVTARRQSSPATLFFARIFGRENLEMSASAIAYIGFAGTLGPEELDQPLAICDDSLRIEGDIYTCTVGRMINSGSNIGTHQTGGWTNYSQDDACLGGTNANEMRDLVCSTGNPGTLFYGNDIGTSGGMVDNVFRDLEDCWLANSNYGRQPWAVTLPVVECEGNNLTTCAPLVGAVEVNFIWINSKNPSSLGPYDPDPQWHDWPVAMSGVPGYSDWVSPDPPSLEDSWTSFVENFNLKAPDGVSDAELLNKCIYFIPDCTPHEPAGRSGGQNFGVLARIPVIVD